MSSIIFKALIDSVHYDPKKGSVKIQLIGASHVSLDKLTTLAPKDEPVSVTLESAQTKIEVFPLAPPEDISEPSEGGEEEIIPELSATYAPSEEELNEPGQLDKFTEEPDGEEE